MTGYVVDCVEYISSVKAPGGVYREVMGRNFPAMACVLVATLAQEHVRVETDTTVVAPD
jgi:enamine deaminase RidA (YjgF/YER057c/UK114 family)